MTSRRVLLVDDDPNQIGRMGGNIYSAIECPDIVIAKNLQEALEIVLAVERELFHAALIDFMLSEREEMVSIPIFKELYEWDLKGWGENRFALSSSSPPEYLRDGFKRAGIPFPHYIRKGNDAPVFTWLESLSDREA